MTTSWKSPLMTAAYFDQTLCRFAVHVLLLTVAFATQALGDDESSWRTGSSFRQAIQEKTSLDGQGERLFKLVGFLRDAKRVAIVLDRRMNPDLPIFKQVTDQPLTGLLKHFVEASHGTAVVVENVIVVGPQSSLKTLRTFAELRHNEVQEKASPSRKSALLGKISIDWKPLATPREILDDILDQAKLQCDNRSLIPHDHWNDGALPAVTVPAALSILLHQLQVTWEWKNDFQRIELKPLPAELPSLTVRVTKPGRFSPQSLETIARTCPDLRVDATGKEIELKGLLDDIDQAREILAGANTKPERPEKNLPPLARRSFTLKVADVPARRIMDELEKQGIRFEFDATAFQEAGINLEKKVSVDIKNGKADELLKQIFEPLGVEFRYTGLTVTLTVIDKK